MNHPKRQQATQFKFSKQRIEQLPAPEKAVAYFYDEATRGLAISVGITGRKSFFLYRKVDGIPRRIKIGLFPDISVEQARKEAEKLNGEIATGGTPSNTPQKSRTGIRFSTAFENYMEQHSKPKKITWKADEALYNRNLTGKRKGCEDLDLSSMFLVNVDVHVVRALHRAMHKKPIAANRTLALVSSIFSHAIREETHLGLNPCRAITKYTERTRERFLQRDEAPMLREALKSDHDDRLVDFISLALLTGVRRGDVMKMRWEHISWIRAEWLIPRTKNGQSQTVPLPLEAVKLLQRRHNSQLQKKNESPFVFPGTSKTGHLVEPKVGWKRICQRATALKLISLLIDRGYTFEEGAQLAKEGAISSPEETIKKFESVARQFKIAVSEYDMRMLWVHDLRRTVGSWLASSGASLPLIGKVLNHKSAQSTQIYARFMLDPVRSALEQVAASIEATNQMGGITVNDIS